MKWRMMLAVLSLACGLAHSVGAQSGGGRIVVVTSSGVAVMDVRGSDTLWRWSFPAGPVDGASAQVFPDGSGSYNVLVVVPGVGTCRTYCLNGATGQVKWDTEGFPPHTHEDAVLNHNVYTDPDQFPQGPPDLGGSSAPDILINRRAIGGGTSHVLCVDGETGALLWDLPVSGDRWASGFIPDVNGDGFYDFVVRSENAGGFSGLYCISGRDGATQIWHNPSASRGGVTVGDVNGDGYWDYAVGECCYDDRVQVLNGVNGMVLWEAPYNSFDVLGIKRLPRTSDIIVAAQGSFGAGGVRRLNGRSGQVLWSCPSTYNNQTLAGVIPVPNGYYVLSGWRHHYLAICLDTATGNIIWDNIPASDADRVGLVVPDQNADGFGEVLIMNNGAVALYSSATGAKIADLPGVSDVEALAWLPESAPAHCFYVQDFSLDPGFITDDPHNLRWDAAAGTFHGVQTNWFGTYAYVTVPGFDPNRPWRLTLEHRIIANRWSAGMTVGLFDERMSYVFGAGFDMSQTDGGQGTGMFANGLGPPASFSPAWRLGVWYRDILEYDPVSGLLRLEIRERDTRVLLAALSVPARNFPATMTRFGVSRVHTKGASSGINPWAWTEYELDNIQVCSTEPVAPAITAQPVSQTVGDGKRVTLSVEVSGTGPMQFQWQRNGQDIPGANGRTLDLSDVSMEKAGSYRVVISNAAGSVTSAEAVLTVTDLKRFAGLIIAGPVGARYRVECARSLGQSEEWRTLATIVLPSTPYVFIDYDSPNHARCFYRAVYEPQP